MDQAVQSTHTHPGSSARYPLDQCGRHWLDDQQWLANLQCLSSFRL